MLYTLLAIVIILIAVVLVYRSLKFLWLNSWFLGWVRGTFGLCLLALGVGIGLVAYDIYTYKQILVGQPIATIHFEGIEAQLFDVVLVETTGKQQRFKLRGDQWQLDTRVVKWRGYLANYDVKPAFRLDRLSGRFFDIEKESAAKRPAFPIVQSLLKIDLWQFINDHPKWFPIVDTTHGSARYLPMKAGALYEISLSATGLNVRPLNDVASSAEAEWK